MLKVGIVGCGKIADSHAAQIGRIKDCEIIAVCDQEELMARQLAERFGVKYRFTDLGELLQAARPDVIHLTTPPQSHFALGKQCLNAGCHVYVEKPFTLHTADAEELLGLADRKGLKVTAGHDDQFRHAARRMRALVQSGYLGGPPVHMESYYCYEMGEGYAKALLADKQHWVRKLPGQLLHNIISHGIARIAEFITDDNPAVLVHAFVSPFLRELGEEEIVDELRVIISAEDQTTAYFTFSSQMRPSLHEFRLYGPRHGLALNQDHETLIRLPGKRHKSYLEFFVPPVSFARQYFANWSTNLRTFLKADFHMKSGMKHLMEAFYRSIRDNSPPPIPYREIILTARIMEKIFDQIRSRQGVNLVELSASTAARLSG